MTENERTIIDTNILIYSVDTTDKEKQIIAREIISATSIQDNAHISIQNLAEFSNAVTRRTQYPFTHEEAKNYVRNFADVFNVMAYSEKEIQTAHDICHNYKTHFWDALLAATMKANNINIIITENEKDFKKIKGITVINPFKATL